jgi:predicted transcriptional regulator
MLKPQKMRFSISVSPELLAALDAVASATGAARASVAAELLEETIPTLLNIAKAVTAAKNNQSEAFDILNSAMYEAMNKAGQMGLELTEVRRGIRRSPAKDESPDS